VKLQVKQAFVTKLVHTLISSKTITQGESVLDDIRLLAHATEISFVFVLFYVSYLGSIVPAFTLIFQHGKKK